MGLFDYVTVDHPSFVCSEGHDLRGAEFQTKDLGETMGHAYVGSWIDFIHGGWGPDQVGSITGEIEVYCSCHQCPVYIQARTGNLMDIWCEFTVEIVEDIVRSVKRTSESTADWLASIPNLKYMEGAEGPMAFAEASVKRREALRAVFDRRPAT